MTHRRLLATRRRQILILTAALTLGLSGCGKSVDETHETIVKCAGFDSGFMAAGMATGIAGMGAANQPGADTSALTNAQSFMNTVQQTLQTDNITAGSVIPADAVKRYTDAMDPAKATRLQIEVVEYSASGDRRGTVVITPNDDGKALLFTFPGSPIKCHYKRA
jgi:hypothetical protein